MKIFGKIDPTPKSKIFQEFVKDKVAKTNFESICNCGNFMFLSTGSKKTMSCNNRFCPMCNYKKSHKDVLIISILIEYLKNKYSFILLPLISSSVTGNELNKEVIDFNLSFKRMSKHKLFEKAVVGYIRKLEVTYNSEREDYNPHFHILLAVKKNYYSNNYISHNKWLEMWQLAKRDDTIREVKIQKLKLRKNDKKIFEFTDYSLKSSSYLESKEMFNIIYDALKGKKLITFNGVFKEALKLYKNGSLDHLK